MSNRLKWSWVEWTLIAFVIAGVVSILPAFRGWPMVVQDIGFCFMVVPLVWLPGLAWWRLVRLRRDQGWSTWRAWVALAGCIALSAALVIPIAAVVAFPFMWDLLTAWLIVSAAAFFLGLLAGTPVRFPLVLGGGAWVSFVILIPKGVL